MIKNRTEIIILTFFYLMLSVVVLSETKQFLGDSSLLAGLGINLIPFSTIILCIGSLVYLAMSDTKPKNPFLKGIYRCYGVIAILYGIGIFLLGSYVWGSFDRIALMAMIPAIGSIYLGILISTSHKKKEVVLDNE